MKNKKALATIIDALSLREGDVVVEIGPGRGALTLPLIERCQEIDCKVIAIEKDERLANALEERCGNKKNFTVIQEDALTSLPSLIHDSEFMIRGYKMLGNIPYYITGRLLRTITEFEAPPERAVLTIQREVAERLTAAPPRMNLLAAAIQHAANVDILMHLKPSDFSPPPKVRSSIVQLTDITPFSSEAKEYYVFIRIAFRQPRKQLINNLKKKYSEEHIKKALARLHLPATIRAHNLSVEQLKKLAAFLHNKNKN